MTVKSTRPGGEDLPYPGKPEQLKLFMTGSEWKNQVTHSTDGPIDIIWEEKADQAKVPKHGTTHGAGVYDSMEKHGYDAKQSRNSQPTMVFETSPNGKELRRTQSEGHHRVAAADALESEGKRTVYIPTNYIDTTPGGRKAMHRGR